MSYCDNCGAEIKRQSAKFCSKCGSLVQQEKEGNEIAAETKETSRPIDLDDNQMTIETGPSIPNAHDLGKKFEDAVESILKHEGYTTTRDVRLVNKNGLKSEIDILAKRAFKGNDETIAVECKNFDSSVAVEKIRDFKSKLDSLEIKNGLVVVYKELSSEALKWAIAYNLELWNGETVQQKFWALHIGRLGAGQSEKFEYSLPIKINFEKAINLDLDNKSKVNMVSAKLICRPFYKVFYKISCIRTDPSKKQRTIKDSGHYIFDALSGNILKSKDSTQKALSTLSRSIFGGSKDEIRQEKETDIFLEELEQDALKSFSFTQTHDFRIIKLPSPLTNGEVEKLIISEVIEEYTQAVQYTLKKDEDDIWAEARYFKIIPSTKEITLKSQLIYAAKWDIEFESQGFRYIRTVSANSGKMICDTLKHCNDNHWLDGFVNMKTIAVCDVCGKALCKDHISKCPTCGSWRCEAHSFRCTDCRKRFCPEHITTHCVECKGLICSKCALKCPICSETHCSTHMTKCSRCNKIICVSCTRKEGGFLIKKTVCKECK